MRIRYYIYPIEYWKRKTNSIEQCYKHAPQITQFGKTDYSTGKGFK